MEQARDFDVPGTTANTARRAFLQENRNPAAEPGRSAGENSSPRTTKSPSWHPLSRARPRQAPPHVGWIRQDRPRWITPPFTFISPLDLASPMTRTHVRLLGPCFKTGRVGHRSFARRESVALATLCCTTVAGQPGHRRFPPPDEKRLPEEPSPCGVPIQQTGL